ncbi:hypothetical protein N7466_002630 [Penicillium verhagenii]|uniref:uncharacterized protein n=1 Tax=Penicillium verhagenii TaxID=1562060 RepID=UPI0025452DB4|nr:uncharacterized protein N7466_002630 [Penicillium verhagenii]KAJ5939496.1 hypothetical protein N7466_002630 [Penicillium verhagenii]
MGHTTPHADSHAQEAAPAYEDLYEQPPSNQATGYSHIPTAEEPYDIEHQGHHHHHGHHHHEQDGQGHEHQGHEHNPASVNATALHLTTNSGAPVHFHCEECDRRQERRERRKSNQNCCMMVSATFIIITFLLSVFVFRMVAELHKKGNGKNSRDFPGEIHILGA